MALLLEQTLYNADVVRYHRIAEYRFNGSNCVAVLHSFRTLDDRVMPSLPVVIREFNFIYTGGDYAAQAYAAIKALPEWANAQDV